MSKNIDPPYNTGKDFVYKDDFRDSLENYKRITGQVDGDGNRVTSNPEYSGRYHTDWLNMVYPRLRLARNLLSEDGVIFISIDDNELPNLTKICDEIFGEANFVSILVWQKNFAPKNDNKYISSSTDYILLYSKYKEYFNRGMLPREEKHNKGYNNPDDDPRGLWTSGSMLATTFSETGVYEIVSPTGKINLPANGRCWRFSKAKTKELIEDNRVWFGSDGNGVPRIKRFLSDMPQGIVPQDLLLYKEVGSNQDGNKELKELFNTQLFDFPKNTRLIDRFLTISNVKNDDIILDFFSGSATTAHAVMQLNAEDGGNRKFIMVQLPEPTDEKSEAYKAGYFNICEIGKERIRRAGEKIKADNQDKDGIEDLDIGFKVFKLDTSNIRKWQPDYDHLEQSILDYIDNYVDGRSELDVVYEIMLKYGLDLTYPVDVFTVSGKKIYSIGFGMLMICLDNEITTEIAHGILDKAQELRAESTRVVFKDNGFKTDSNKTNIKEILKSGGIEEFVTL